MTSARGLIGLSAILIGALASSPTMAKPWRLQDQIGQSDWNLGGQALLRFESLDGQFRGNADGSEQLLSTLTSIHGGYRFRNVSLAAEFTDARQFLSDEESPMNTGIVNTLEWTQANIGWTLKNPGEHSGTLTLTLGRQAFDLGSRRLIAHTRFRNATNTFTGLNATWHDASNNQYTALYLLPVLRRPTDAPSLRDNERQSDIESHHIRLFGGYLQRSDVAQGWNLDATALRLEESDTPAIATADRQITTAGFRLDRPVKSSPLGAQIEGYYQWGQTRSSAAASDTTTLDHSAWFAHAQVEYALKMAWSPRIQLLYDYASGDKNPDDQKNQRFQRLYGVSRPDFGPTSIYGSFTFENVKSPGLRLITSPSKTSKVLVTWRKFDLAENRDAWTTAKLRDKTGGSGGDLGHQIEAKWVWKAIPGNLEFEAGAAQLFGGEFAEKLEGASFDSRYGYVQTRLVF